MKQEHIDQSRLNAISIGALTISSSDHNIDDLIKLSKKILGDKVFKEYLMSLTMQTITSKDDDYIG